MSFARDTAVRPAKDGRWSGEIRPGWDIGGNANGGYLLTLAARAMIQATGRPDPVTVTGHFLAPGKPGPITVNAEVVKRGRLFTTAFGSLWAADRRLLAVLGTFGDLATASGPERVDAAAGGLRRLAPHRVLSTALHGPRRPASASRRRRVPGGCAEW